MADSKHDYMEAPKRPNLDDSDTASPAGVLTPASTVAEDAPRVNLNAAQQSNQSAHLFNSENPPKSTSESASASKPSALFEAAKLGQAPTVAKLLDHGANVDYGGVWVPPSNWSPLCTAAKRGHLETVKILLARDANVHLADESGWTAIHTASRWGHDEIVELLLKAGANPSVKDRSDWTPLHTAALHGHPGVLKVLAEHGADTQVRDKGGRTPLIVAIRNGQTVAEFLVAYEPREPPPAYVPA